MNIGAFKNNLEKYAAIYNPGSLFDKIATYAKKAGIKTVYIILILYYASFDKSLPVKDRLMVIAALGYFILPVDLLPDAMVGGFVDDAGAALYVLKHIWHNLSDETFRKAKLKLNDWFGSVEESDLKINNESSIGEGSCKSQSE